MTVSLSSQQLKDEAGPSTYKRGREITRDVVDLSIEQSSASAQVNGTHVYQVVLRWTPALYGTCSCPHYRAGNFCKHLVALGLVVLGENTPATRGASQRSIDQESEFSPEDFINAATEAELRRYLLILASKLSSVQDFLKEQAHLSSPSSSYVSEELTRELTATLSVRGFIDYRHAMELGKDALNLVDRLRQRLAEGFAEDVAPVALKLTTRLRKMLTSRVDDSSGMVGDACQAALNIYAEACAASSVDPRRLGKWLAKFNLESPGWPNAPLELFLPALGASGLDVYRQAIVKAVHAVPDGNLSTWEYFTVEQLYLELLEIDGEVDTAVPLLLAGRRPRYAAIIRLLEKAGREREAMAFLDKAIAADAITNPTPSFSRYENDYDLSPARVVEMLLQHTQDEKALDFVRKRFEAHPSLQHYRLRLDVAQKIGNASTENALINEWIEAQKWPNGSVPIAIALEEGDTERAWRAAKQWGAGNQWEALVTLMPQPYPMDAIELFFEQTLIPLAKTGRKAAREALIYLKRARRLARFADAESSQKNGIVVTSHQDRLAEYVEELRASFSNRPALLNELSFEGF